MNEIIFKDQEELDVMDNWAVFMGFTDYLAYIKPIKGDDVVLTVFNKTY